MRNMKLCTIMKDGFYPLMMFNVRISYEFKTMLYSFSQNSNSLINLNLRSNYSDSTYIFHIKETFDKCLKSLIKIYCRSTEIFFFHFISHNASCWISFRFKFRVVANSAQNHTHKLKGAILYVWIEWTCWNEFICSSHFHLTNQQTFCMSVSWEYDFHSLHNSFIFITLDE